MPIQLYLEANKYKISKKKMKHLDKIIFKSKLKENLF